MEWEAHRESGFHFQHRSFTSLEGWMPVPGMISWWHSWIGAHTLQKGRQAEDVRASEPWNYHLLLKKLRPEVGRNMP